MSLSSFAAALLAAFTLAYPMASQAVTLNVDLGTGQLLGATEVDVDGVLYDVDFVDGSCVALFGGCDASDDFTFTTEVEALAATNALQSQVFVDTVAGNFDTQPELTNGCESTFSCSIYTPFGISSLTPILVDVVAFANQTGSGDLTFTTTQLTFDDITANPSLVFADWGLSETAVVPLPASGWLILSGLAGLFLVRYRKPKAAMEA